MSTETGLLGLRENLRLLGYDARIVNGDCFDIHQGSAVHYLSKSEAEALVRAGTGVDLMAHSERRGPNRWYDFKRERARDYQKESRQ